MRSHLKLYFDFETKTKELSDEEKGRLLLAMLRYAKDGIEESLDGNERFLFPVFKIQIDEDINTYETKVSNGSKGGRPVKNEEPEETENNLKEPNETENNIEEPNETEIAKKEERRKKKEDKRKKINEYFAQFWAAYPRKEAKANAMKAFEKIDPDEELMGKMLKAIEKKKESSQWKENGGQYIPHPATWLNGHRWEDEIKNGTPIRAVSAQQYEQRDYSGEQEKAMERMLMAIRENGV